MKANDYENLLNFAQVSNIKKSSKVRFLTVLYSLKKKQSKTRKHEGYQGIQITLVADIQFDYRALWRVTESHLKVYNTIALANIIQTF